MSKAPSGAAGAGSGLAGSGVGSGLEGTRAFKCNVYIHAPVYDLVLAVTWQL